MQNIKNPNPKAALPLDLARTKSAPPEGKIAEFGALLNNKINISNTNPVSNQQKQEKVPYKTFS